MSSSITLTSFPHLSWHHPKQEIILIQEDILTSQLLLKEFKTLPSDASEAKKIFTLEKMTNCAKVFNQNVAYVVKKIRAETIPAPQSLQAYMASQHFLNAGSSPQRQQTYIDEFKRESHVQENNRENQLDEKHVCVELIPHLHYLKSKIEKTIVRLHTTFPDVKFGQILLTQVPEYSSCFTFQMFQDIPHAPQLRTAYSFVDSSSTSASTTTTTTTTATVTTTTTTTTTTTPPPLNTLPVAISHAVNVGQVLGTCCSPSWANPVAFTFQDGKWVGEISKDVEFKFVLLKDGEIVKWEKGLNRKIDDSNVQNLSSVQIKF